MTLPRVQVDLSRSFGPGMGYTALSRAVSGEAVRLLGWSEAAMQSCPEAKAMYASAEPETRKLVVAMETRDAAR